MEFATTRDVIARHASRDVGSGATSSQIEEAERALGVKIKGGYRAFLEAFGWGGVEDIELFGLGGDVPPHLELVAVTQSERTEAIPPLPAELVPLMNDGAGNLYCLDAREPYRHEYPVVFWNHEEGPDQEPEPAADDFGSWLRALVASRSS